MSDSEKSLLNDFIKKTTPWRCGFIGVGEFNTNRH
jgi:hypothetical protein